MLVGSFPFCNPEKTTFEELCSNVRNNQLQFPIGLVSEDAQDLISGMLAKRKRRISIEEIRTHKWLHS
jgi:hypothetical protein